MSVILTVYHEVMCLAKSVFCEIQYQIFDYSQLHYILHYALVLLVSNPDIREYICCPYHLVSTSSPPRLHLVSTSSPPRLHLVSTSSPPRLHLVSTSSPPRLHLVSTSSPPRLHLVSTSSPPRLHLVSISSPSRLHLVSISSPSPSTVTHSLYLYIDCPYRSQYRIDVWIISPVLCHCGRHAQRSFSAFAVQCSRAVPFDLR